MGSGVVFIITKRTLALSLNSRQTHGKLIWRTENIPQSKGDMYQDDSVCPRLKWGKNPIILALKNKIVSMTHEIHNKLVRVRCKCFQEKI